MTVLLVTLWSSIKEVKAPFLGDGEHGNALHVMQGNRASSSVDLGSMELFWVAAVTSVSL